ncbi:hypothetical protein GCM10022254_09640 [Actinomadura meridiana]|uniref:Uncharacterized protein n=1 Tax=Actinomadura meridiana TaxID=559626 RepID=A0ABP8BTR1_9ACTN
MEKIEDGCAASVSDAELWDQLKQMDTLQRSTVPDFAQHLRMAQVCAAISEAETAPEWAIARAEQAQAHAAIAALLRGQSETEIRAAALTAAARLEPWTDRCNSADARNDEVAERTVTMARQFEDYIRGESR